MVKPPIKVYTTCMSKEKIIKTLNSPPFLFSLAGVVILGVIISFILQIHLLKTQGNFAGFAGSTYADTKLNTIQGWMTINYLSKVYHVTPKYLQENLDIPANAYM